ncbi:LytR/AlgR family response regulator transcription factor [Caulobacter mirabilis]|uniref:HTH LytTR-type domain-containing protein n=1 Tax=Caulobacter mirabilis TaxID=69666 RepID=A0A2D2AVG2_9CAUL|nr:LytTR family DNA-binding domain-containing protein [Caulobacter mirabilis]ATQ41999.1 hypothetical protein CSW64_06015 [Caulobacter mirabilis]
MWRILILAGLLAALSSAASTAWAREAAWAVCTGRRAAEGPVLRDCRPLEGVIDPQGRELWIRAMVQAPSGDGPHALYLAGAASSEAWLNGRRLGANGRPGADAGQEQPGRYQSALPVPAAAWKPGANELVVHLSSFHGGLPLARPMGMAAIGPYPLPSRLPVLAVTLATAGALAAAAFGFGAIHGVRRTRSSLILAALAAVAALQAAAETLRPLYNYPYPLHVWRLGLIWLLAAAFAILLATYAAGRFSPRWRRGIVGAALVLVGGTAFLPGFDSKTGWALLAGIVLALAAALIGVRSRVPGARPTAAYLALFIVLAFALPELFVDLSHFLFAAGLVLPLLMVEVVRLGRADLGRETALTQAVHRPDRLTVASAKGVEFVRMAEIIAITGADDYAELRLAGGRRLLHAARLDQLESELPADFLRVHRSAIANLAFVQRLERAGDGRWRLHLAGGEVLNVSRSRLPALRDQLDDRAPPVVATALTTTGAPRERQDAPV